MRTKNTRRRMGKPTAILSADMHLREDTPICRTDDYFAAQAKKIKFLSDLQREHDCPILDAGDVFDNWKPSPYLLGWVIANLPNKSMLLTVPGNHDLPQHNMENIEKSGLSVLHKAKMIWILHERERNHCSGFTAHGFPYQSVIQPPIEMARSNVALSHQMTWHLKKPYLGCTAGSAMKLLQKHKEYDLIVTGDNHQPFVVEHEGRLLVNPGSMMRMTAAQKDHRPRVYLWYAEGRKVRPVYYPIEKDVISREHIERTESRDERIEAFVTRLKGECEIGLSFEKNLEEFMDKNKTSTAVKELIKGILE